MATLDIGPGKNIQPHFDRPVIRVDRRREVKPHVVADARALPFRGGAFSTVYASHILEHFHWKEASNVLQEWARVVSADGELQVMVPNLEWSALQITHGIVDEFVMNALFGRQENHLDVHRSGFVPTSLRDLIWRTGLCKLNEIETRTFRNSILIFAKRTQDG